MSVLIVKSFYLVHKRLIALRTAAGFESAKSSSKAIVLTPCDRLPNLNAFAKPFFYCVIVAAEGRS